MPRRSFTHRARATPSPPANGSKQAEFLIDQCQKLAAIYDQRRSDADSQATTVLTTAVTLAALIITASATLSGTSTGLAVAAMIILAFSTAFAVWERSGAGLRPHGQSWRETVPEWKKTVSKLFRDQPADEESQRPADATVDQPEQAKSDQRPTAHGASRPGLLSHSSPGSSDAAHAFACAMRSQNCDAAHDATLNLWRNRADDLHYIAKAKERAAALAGIVLAVAVILIAVLAIELVGDPHSTSGTTHTTSAKAAANTARPVVVGDAEPRAESPRRLGS